MGGEIGFVDFVGYAVGDPDNVTPPSGPSFPFGSLWLMGNNNVLEMPWLGTK